MILVVEDDMDLAEACQMVLESSGYEVEVAHDAEEALAKIMRQKPDLLISDCIMPGRTGVELSDQLRTVYTRGVLPILLMSGSLRNQVAHGDSYDGFLCKPFLAESLLSEVKKLLQGGPLSGLTPVPGRQ